MEANHHRLRKLLEEESRTSEGSQPWIEEVLLFLLALLLGAIVGVLLQVLGGIADGLVNAGVVHGSGRKSLSSGVEGGEAMAAKGIDNHNLPGQDAVWLCPRGSWRGGGRRVRP